MLEKSWTFTEITMNKFHLLGTVFTAAIRSVTFLALFIGFPLTANAVYITFSSVSYPNATTTVIKGINDNGDVVGEYLSSIDGEGHAFYSTQGTLTNVDYPGSTFREGWGINNSGVVVGGRVDPNGRYDGYSFDGTSYTLFNVPGSTWTDLFNIDDSGRMLGGYSDGTTYRPFIYDSANPNFTYLPDPVANVNWFVPLDINNNNQLVGSYQDSGNMTHGFLFDGTNYSSIDFPNALWTETTGINENGQIVGYYGDINNITHGYIFDSISLTYTDINLAGVTGTFIYDINNAGMLAGAYTTTVGANKLGFTATLTGINPVPIPPSVWLFGSGLLGLVGIARRKKA